MISSPVFVAGSKRSGTYAVGNLLGAHRNYFMLPHELVLHCVPYGLQGFLRYAFDEATLAQALTTYWWDRSEPWDAGTKRGLHKLMPREDLDRAVSRFTAAAVQDRRVAARALMDSLVASIRNGDGTRHWVEMSPPNLIAAPELVQIYPLCRFVHVVRDGRDVACSLVRLPWGPTDLHEALDHWADQLRQAAAAQRAVGDRYVHTVHLEDLALLDRDRSYSALCDFLQVPADEGMSRFFRQELTAQRAHLGRWSVEVPMDAATAVDEHYRSLLEALHAEGVRAPAYRSLPVGHAPHADEPRNPFDPWADGVAADA